MDFTSEQASFSSSPYTVITCRASVSAERQCQKYKRNFSNLALFHRRHAAGRKTHAAGRQPNQTHLAPGLTAGEEIKMINHAKPPIKHGEIRRLVLLL